VINSEERRPAAEGGVPGTANSTTRISREGQLRAAVGKAALPVRDYRVYHALLGRAEWRTAVIPGKFQPRSLRDLAALSRMSTAGVCRSLNHLESHGWVERQRRPPGRGHATAYTLLAGADCDCIPATETGEPMPGAERARRYRQRKKASQNSVTEYASKASHNNVTDDSKAFQPETLSPDKASQIERGKRLASRDDDAGQTRFSAKEGVEEGEVRKGWPENSIGADMNPWPTARIPGVSGGPVPDDPDERQALRCLAEILGPIQIMEPK
jgi:DNA-binding MarR family transcriptional regulator